MSYSFDSLLATLQNQSLLGFPLLYWTAGGLAILVLCCCITCCICCRKRQKKRREAEKHLSALHELDIISPEISQFTSGSTNQMTSVTARQRQSMENKHHQANDKKFMKRDSYQAYDLYHQNKKNQQVNRAQAASVQVPNQHHPPDNQYGRQGPSSMPGHQNNFNPNPQNNNFNAPLNSNPHNQYSPNNNPQQYDHNNQKQRRNDNNFNPNQNAYQHNQQPNRDRNVYGNAGDDHSNQYGHNQQGNFNANQPNNAQQIANKFGFQLPDSVYNSGQVGPPPAVRSTSHSHAQQNGYSRSPPPQQNYSLGVQQDMNNFQSHSAPAPSSDQIRQLQQQFPPPSNDHVGVDMDDDAFSPPLPQHDQNQEYQVKKLGDGSRNSSKWREQQQKKSKNQHFTAMSDINEDTVKKINPQHMKMNIETIEKEEPPAANQIKAPPRRKRNSEAQGTKPRTASLAAPGSPKAAGQNYGGLSAPKFPRRKKPKDESVNADEYSDSEERAKISSWDARRSSVQAQDLPVDMNEKFQGRRKSVFDDSSSDEEDDNNNTGFGGRRLTVDLHRAENRNVSGHMGNLGRYG
eukprot:74980_1